MLDALFSPLRVGPVELPNRIVSTAHQTTLVHERLPTDDFVAYHEARARGGTGLIVLEATAVHPSGLLTPHTLAGYREEIVPEPGPCRRGRARARDAPLRAALPRRARADRRPRRARPRSPRPRSRASASTSSRAPSSTGEIASIVEGYARAAALAAKAGLDGVEISAAHEYLAAQFFTPALNRREDDVGRAGPLPARGAGRRARARRPGSRSASASRRTPRRRRRSPARWPPASTT